jgi:hypothetical protein
MRRRLAWSFFLLFLAVLARMPGTAAQENLKILSQDYHIDAADDPSIKIFIRTKMAEGNTTFNDDNIVLFVHGATFPSTPDFDLQYKDSAVPLKVE